MEQSVENIPGQGIELEVRCPISTTVLALLRNVATAAARQAGFCDQRVDEIEMAVDEACANVVRHAYKHRGISPDAECERQDHDCSFLLRVTTDGTGIRFCVIDEGIGEGNASTGRIGSLEEFEARGGGGGLGTMIIHRFMDEVEYQYPEKGTILVMKKYLER